MPPPAWHFREMARGEINVDPVHDEFFKAQDLADALVREAVQNSLDARRGRSTVRVRFRLATGSRALTGESAARYLRGLEPHIAVPPHASMPFLLVEDAGTRGLGGEPTEDPELDHDGEDTRSARNDFYYFWRNVGRSGKGELDRGRWGLGKAVFSVSSRIHAMFGLTLRADDDRRLLLGQAVLKTHVIDGRRFAPYGFFPDPMNPIAESAFIDRFVEDFGLERGEPGLSIVVAFHREEDLSFDRIVASAMRQYFYPITRGDLVITVEENGRTETINGRTIEAHTSDPSLARLCELARWSMAISENELTVVAEPPPTAAPKWREDAIPSSQVEILRQRFDAGDRLAFRVRIPVRRKKSRTAVSHFDVAVEKDDALRRAEHHFIRRGITIPEVRAPREGSVRAILIADDEPISTFLGDAENPAHSDWSERNDRIRTRYENGPSTLRYVKNAIAELTKALSTPPAGRMTDLLADIFSIDVPADERPSEDGHGKEEGHRGEAVQTPIRIEARESPLRILRVAGGFAIQGSGNAAERLAGEAGGAPRWAAEVAYRTRVGDPFRKYSSLDFAIGRGGVKLVADGAQVRSARENRIEFLPARADFHVSVTGFDPRRDLVVRVVSRDDDAAEAELH